MSQLALASYYIRKGIKVGTIMLLSFIILKTGYGIFSAYWQKIHPPPEPAPDTAYGKLPAVNFPFQRQPKPVSFLLETVEGSLPTNLPDRARVYYIPKLGGRFSKLDEAKQIAQKLKLNPNGEKLTEDTYLFKNPISRTELEINVLTQNFTYSYDYVHDQTLINPPPLPTKDRAVSIALSFLSKLNKSTAELQEGESTVSYWRIRGERLVSAISASEADFIKVNLFRKKIENQYPIMPPTYPESLVSFLITSQNIQGEQVVETKFINFESDREEFAQYPLLPIEAAWEKIKNGDYFLTSYDGDNKESVKIRGIFLAYYDPYQSTQFLQPIYVFEGDKNFVGYYPAIPPEWQE